VRAPIALVAVAAVLTAAAACTKDQQPPPPPAAAAPPTVTIHARDFAYQGPDSIPAGYVAFTLVNDGPGIHHAAMVRLDSGRTANELIAALGHPGPLPAWAVLFGGPNAVPAGASSNATLLLAPGDYVMLCFVDVPGGVPHFSKGMFRAVTVVPSTVATAAPVADDSITLTEYGFTLARPLTVGHHVFAATNTGVQPHEVEFVKLAPGKTADDLLSWLANEQGPSPGEPIGGASLESTGKTTYFSADLTAGNYLLICFVPDTKDGKPHFMHGMMQTIAVN
jgi:hypothetical protein